MKSDFRIITLMKDFIFSLNDLIDNFPKNEKVLVDGFKKTAFECLELIFYANNVGEKNDLQKQIMSKISMLDFYLEYSFNKKYLSIKQTEKKSNELNVINKMLYGWINAENK